MTIKDTNVTIMVKDMEMSIIFYQSLGFDLKNRWGNHYAQVSVSGVTLGLHPLETGNETGSGTVSIGFITENFEESKALLKELGIPAEERQEQGGQFLHFSDPNKTQLYFYKG